VVVKAAIPAHSVREKPRRSLGRFFSYSSV
jgi:hypothetical protein